MKAKQFADADFLVTFTGECPDSRLIRGWDNVLDYIDKEVGAKEDDWSVRDEGNDLHDEDHWNTADIIGDDDQRHTFYQNEFVYCVCLQITRIITPVDAHEELGEVLAELKLQKEENQRLLKLINHPHNDDWFEGTRIESAHQQERWGSAHDAGKQPQDWFWLIGYLAGKCLRSCIDGDVDKAKHHTISTAAVLLNWHRSIAGEMTAMRPGIDVPVGHVD